MRRHQAALSAPKSLALAGVVAVVLAAFGLR